jgi:hypothetical protein
MGRVDVAVVIVLCVVCWGVLVLQVNEYGTHALNAFCEYIFMSA